MSQQDNNTEPLTKEEIQARVDATFSVFDKNQNGRISTRELESALQCAGANPSRAEVNQMIQDFDLDHSGSLDKGEFKKMMDGRWERDSDPDDYLKAFKVFDKDDDGYLSAKELRTAMTKLGEKMTDREVDLMLKCADTDKDGYINYKEFIRMMTSKELA